MDWFIGYDAFTISTFIQLLGYGTDSTGGNLKTILRDKNMERVDVNFRNDFPYVGSTGDGMMKHYAAKMLLLKDLTLQILTVVSLSTFLSKAIGHSLAKI